MKRMTLGFAGLMAATLFIPAAAQARDWDDGYYRHDRGHHRGWDRGWDRGRDWRGDRGWHRGWDRDVRWDRGRGRRVCEWRGYYNPRPVCYRVRGW